MLFVIYYRVALVRSFRRRRKTKVPLLDKERLEEAVAGIRTIRTVNSLGTGEARAPWLLFRMVPIVLFDAGGTIYST